MKYKGYLTTDHVLLTSKKIEGLSYEEEREINFDKLLSINYPFQDLKNKIRSRKEKKISLELNGHSFRLSKPHLTKIFNQYKKKDVSQVELGILSSLSPLFIKLNEDWYIIAPIIPTNEWRNRFWRTD